MFDAFASQAFRDFGTEEKGSKLVTRILVIDIEREERSAIVDRLHRQAYEVVVVDSAGRALDEVREAGFDLILLSSSQLAGGVNGPDLCREIKALPAYTNVPVLIFCHDEYSKPVAEKTYDSGCEAFLCKHTLPTLERVIEVMLRISERSHGLKEKNSELRFENKRLDDALHQNAEAVSLEGGGLSSLIQQEYAAGRPDGVLLTDATGSVRLADRGARELLGTELEGRTLGTLAPATRLEAFVRDTRSEPRQGFRFELPARNGSTARSLVASVVPLTNGAANGLRAVLLLDVGRRRLAEAALESQDRGLPRHQLAPLMEAARVVFSPGAITGESQPTEALRRRIQSATTRKVPVLIIGERGTGKETVARVLHFSGLSTGPFLQARCTVLSSQSLEYELFGYEKDSIPGAVADRPGLWDMARDGALFIEEIGHLSLELQERLLELVKTQQAPSEGNGRKARKPNVRLVASTTRDLHAEARAGRFLPELLAVFRDCSLRMPTLSERREDVPALATEFLRRFGGFNEVYSISAEASTALQSYDWPGNVSELEDCIEQACSRAEDGIIEIHNLTRHLRELARELPPQSINGAALGRAALTPRAPLPTSAPQPIPIARHMHEWDITEEDPINFEVYERKAILRALDTCHGNKIAAAHLLNIGKSTLYRKLKHLGISA